MPKHKAESSSAIAIPCKLPKKRHNPEELRKKSTRPTEQNKERKLRIPAVRRLIKKGVKPSFRKPSKQFGDDVGQQCTVFIRNLPYEVTDEDLKEFFATTAPDCSVAMAVIVKDKQSKLPKGTAFVKFDNLFEAEKVVKESQDEFTRSKYIFKGRQLTINLAVSRDDIKNKPEQESNDLGYCLQGRNLHLAHVGVIKPNSKEAEGISPQDMQLRVQLLKMKEEKLRNPSIFVSPFRLCLRNIPKSLADADLKICIKELCPTAKITECRIMRNLKENNKSLGYAFVTLTEHKSALEVLRKANNCKEVFPSGKVPIVEFSLEDQRALDKKQRRQKKSSQKPVQGQSTPQPRDDSKLMKAMSKKKSLSSLIVKSTPKKISGGLKKRHKYRGPANKASKPKGKLSRKDKLAQKDIQ